MKKILLFLFCLSLVANLASSTYCIYLSVHNHVNMYPVMGDDSLLYAALAKNMVANHTFSIDTVTPFRLYTIGYPLFLLVTRAISGGFMLAVYLQILLAACATIFVYLMARRFLPDWTALIPAILFAVSPEMIFSNTIIMTDGLAASLLVFFIYMLFFNTKWRGWPLSLSAGALLGILTLARPITQFLFTLVIVAYLVIDKEKFTEKIKQTAIIFFGFLLIISPWLIRNKILFDHYQVSTVGVSNIMAYVDLFHTSQLLDKHGIHYFILLSRFSNTSEYAQVKAQTDRDLAALTPAGKDTVDYMSKLAWYYIVKDPIHYTYFHLVNEIPMFIGGGFIDYARSTATLRGAQNSSVSVNKLQAVTTSFNQGGILAVLEKILSLLPRFLETLWQILISILAFAGFIRAIVMRQKILIFFGLLIFYFGLLAGPFSTVRFRIPVEAFILILATVEGRAIVMWFRKRGLTT